VYVGDGNVRSEIIFSFVALRGVNEKHKLFRPVYVKTVYFISRSCKVAGIFAFFLSKIQAALTSTENDSEIILSDDKP